MLASTRRIDRRSRARIVASRLRRALARAARDLPLPLRADPDRRGDGRGARAVHLRDLLTRWTASGSSLACPACGGTLSATWSCSGCARALRRRRRCPQSSAARRWRDGNGAPLLRARAVPRLSAAREPAELRARAERQCLRATARPRDSRRRAHCRRRMRHRTDVSVPRARRPRGGGRRSDARIARARRRRGRALRSRPRAVRRDRSPSARPAARRLRRRLLVGRRAPHAATRARRSRGLAELARPGRRHRARCLQRDRAHSRRGSRRAWRGCQATVSCPFDPVLRDRAQDPARRDAWLRDQYRHPEEHPHTIAEVQRWFAEHDVEYLRTYPSAVFGDKSRISSRAPPTTGGSKAGSRNWAGCGRSGARAGCSSRSVSAARPHPIGDHKRVGAAVSILTPRCHGPANLYGCWPKGQCHVADI